MLQRVVRLVGEVVASIVVVAAAGQTLPPLPACVTVATDRRQGRGPLEGLAAGLATIDPQVDAAYVTGCDVPLLVPAFVARLFDRLGDNDIAVPKDGDHFEPLAAVYRCRVRAAVKALLAADQLRPAFLFERVKTHAIPVERFRTVDPELNTLLNINRPEDYTTALRRAGSHFVQ
jgi:molybdenum cofactor guanylyltransferase